MKDDKDAIAEAEFNVRNAIEHDMVPSLDWSLPTLLVEYDRRAERIANLEAGREVEQNALRNAMAMLGQLREALEEAVAELQRAPDISGEYYLLGEHLAPINRFRAVLGLPARTKADEDDEDDGGDWEDDDD